jgi:hypothetical protein
MLGTAWIDRPIDTQGWAPCFHVPLSAAWKRGHAQANGRHSSRVFAMPLEGPTFARADFLGGAEGIQTSTSAERPRAGRSSRSRSSTAFAAKRRLRIRSQTGAASLALRAASASQVSPVPKVGS